MVAFPNCKINLGLNIVGKRADGYHDIETVFYPLSLTDALEIIPAQEATLNGKVPANGVLFTTSGVPIEGEPASNLCVKAYELLNAEAGNLPPICMHLHKHIPTGAGLGGGSADAAYALRMIDELFGLQLPEIRLSDLALLLGSDCPFFLYNRPCFATSRGERLTPIDLDLNRYTILLVHPNRPISTREAFSKINPAHPLQSVSNICRMPIDTWKDVLKNDFEEALFSYYPVLDEIKEGLYKAGALYGSLSGSGSTVFAIFENPPAELSLPVGCRLTTLPRKAQ